MQPVVQPSKRQTVQLWSPNSVIRAALAKVLEAHRTVKISGCTKDLSPTLPVIAAVPTPAPMIASAIQNGATVDDAILWGRDQMLSIAELHQHHRENAVILDEAALAAAPQDVLALLEIPATAAALRTLEGAKSHEIDPLMLCLAQQQLQTDVGLRDLAQTCASAFSLRLPFEDDMPLAAAWEKARDNAAHSQAIALLQEQRCALQAQLEALYNAKLETELKLQEERILAVARVEELLKVEQTLKQKITHFRASRSYRLTAPLRKTRAILARRKEKP